MIEFLRILLESGFIYSACYIANIVGKCVIAFIVTKNTALSDKKVEIVTNMMSKDINIRNI